MTNRELDVLLDGGQGATLTFTNGEQVRFTRHELKHPHAWRAAIRRAFGHIGYEPPHYDQEDHDALIRVCFALADAERGGACAPVEQRPKEVTAKGVT
jgi:hypothetical protein